MDWIIRTASWAFAYGVVGSVAVFVGTHIGDGWRDPKNSRWAFVVPILIFGMIIYHFPTFLAAMASGGSDY